MVGTAADSRRSSLAAGRCLAQAVVFLVLFALARSFGLLGPPVVSAGILTLGMALIAWRSGVTLDDLGLRGEHLRSGLAYGFGAFALVLAVLLLAALVSATRSFLHDTRAEIDGGQLAYEVGVTIVLLTAVPEELAFRGVVLASASRLWGSRYAVLVSSGLFGLWHIEPTLKTMWGNDAVGGAASSSAGTAALVVGSVLVTFVAGLVFSWLRLRSRSLVAPFIAHVATNGLALVVAWLLVHR